MQHDNNMNKFVSEWLNCKIVYSITVLHNSIIYLKKMKYPGVR